MSKDIVKEVEDRLPEVAALGVPLDYENRMCDLAIETLADIAECDEAHVYVKWAKVAGKTVPLLYVLFSDRVADLRAMPRVHMNPQGTMCPAHAICLVTMPSAKLLEGDRAKSVIRKGVEEFLLRYKVAGKALGSRL